MEARSPTPGWQLTQALPLAAVAFISGFAVMVVELSAVRVLAPSFGDSVPVWTNVIGVILLALALGAMGGGLCADRGMGRRLLPSVLLVAGAVVLAIPFLVPRVAGWILPEELPLDRALPVLVEGSLAVGLLVFAPPVLLLGAVTPVLIQLGSRNAEGVVGRVSGLVYGAGTIGSLAGTFLATHVLVPRLGLHNTFLVAGAALIVGGLLSLGWGRFGRSAALGLAALLPGASGLVDDPPPVWIPSLGNDARLLETADSYYQRLAVVETYEEVGGQRRRTRLLKINEGLDSFHSVWIDGVPFTNGRYYDTFAVLPFLLGEGASLPAEVRVLSLGCAAGSILRILRSILGSRMIGVGVDLDPEVLALGRKWFELPADDPRLDLIGDLDARVYVDRVHTTRDRFDLVCVDTYRNQFYLPAHLASQEFFAAVRKRLRPGGILALNVGDHGQEGPVLSAVAGTLARVFPCVESFRVGGARNFLLLGHDREAGLMARRLRASRRPPGLSEPLWRQALRPGACRKWPPLPDGEELTDTSSLLDRLHERIYSRLHTSGDDR